MRELKILCGWCLAVDKHPGQWVAKKGGGQERTLYVCVCECNSVFAGLSLWRWTWSPVFLKGPVVAKVYCLFQKQEYLCLNRSSGSGGFWAQLSWDQRPTDTVWKNETADQLIINQTPGRRRQTEGGKWICLEHPTRKALNDSLSWSFRATLGIDAFELRIKAWFIKKRHIIGALISVW